MGLSDTILVCYRTQKSKPSAQRKSTAASKMITDSKKYKSAEFVDSDEDSSVEGSEEETKKQSGWSFKHFIFQS